MTGRNWQDATVPTDADPTTIPIPTDDVIRDVASNARSLAVGGDRISVNTRGLIGPTWATLHTLLFNPDPTRPEIVDGQIVFTVVEPFHVENRSEGFMRARVKANADTHAVESVELSAGLV